MIIQQRNDHSLPKVFPWNQRIKGNLENILDLHKLRLKNNPTLYSQIYAYSNNYIYMKKRFKVGNARIPRTFFHFHYLGDIPNKLFSDSALTEE